MSKPLFVKQIITEVSLRPLNSSADAARMYRLKYDSEGCGRYFTLSDEGESIMINQAEDFLTLYKAAKMMEEQGSIYADGEDGSDVGW